MQWFFHDMKKPIAFLFILEDVNRNNSMYLRSGALCLTKNNIQ